MTTDLAVTLQVREDDKVSETLQAKYEAHYNGGDLIAAASSARPGPTIPSQTSPASGSSPAPSSAASSTNTSGRIEGQVRTGGRVLEPYRVGSARRECVDRMLITGEQHLRLVLTEYVGHYNTHRPYRTLQQNPPAGRAHSPGDVTRMRVLRRDRLGGLITNTCRSHDVT